MKKAILPLAVVLAFFSLGAKHSPVMEVGACNEGDRLTYRSGTWICEAPPVAVPTGGILLIDSGTCPTGFTQHTSLGASRFPMGTVAANGDVGGTAGSNTFTPAGTVGALTFTGTPFSSVINHTHTVSVTDPGHTHTYKSQTATTGSVTSYEHGAIDTSSASANEGGVVDSSTTGITASTANPAGGVASITPAGTINTPSFTGASADQRPAYLKVIFCKKD